MKQHNHSECIKTALAHADKLCRERGCRFTPLRRRVLELVWQSHKAVKAYDLLEILSREAETPAKPPTVYRTLEFLMEQGFVHKIESLNAFVGCPHPEEGHMGQFMICGECETVAEIEDGTVADLLSVVAGAARFKMRSQMVELHGVCANCREML